MSDRNPHRILLAVSGMSPQIITETLYGLLHRKDAEWLPDEIHLITTSGGREQVRLQLLGEQGHFTRFLKDFKIESPIRFDLSTIHVITDSQGQILPDLRTPQDNEAAADFITEKIRQLTTEDNSELHVSLAGGRKTMGFYIGYALSLFGRPQDRLSHVLVSAEYESLSEFYYPTPETRTISTRSDPNKKLDAALAEVYLAEIPFVRLRHFLPQANLLSALSFHEAVALVERAARAPGLIVNLRNHAVTVNDQEIRFDPRDFAFYCWLIERCRCGEVPLLPPVKDTGGDLPMADEYMRHYKAIKHELASTDATTKAMRSGMDRNYFDSAKTRVNRTLRDSLGIHGSRPYLIQTIGSKPKSRYAVTLNSCEITIKD